MDQEDERRQEAPGSGEGSVRFEGRVRLVGEAVVRWVRKEVKRSARSEESVGREGGIIMMMM